MSANVDEARKVVRTLLDDLETVTVKTEGVLMKAKRLARLMRDTDAQLWLDLETSGYPKAFDPDTLGTCKKYAVSSGRVNDQTGQYYVASLPALEGDAQAKEAQINSFRKLEAAPVIENYLVKRATEEFITEQLTIQMNFRKAFTDSKALVAALRSAIHSYATDTYLAIEFGDVAQNIFETARSDVDAFVRAHCPRAAEQIVAINERMLEQTGESRAAALTTCRRLLLTVADSLFPAQAEERTDSSGRKRKVGQDQYKNRLLAWLDERKGSKGSQDVISSDLEHLAARLDAIYDKASKGVHVDVTEQEARLAVIHTYLFIGELAAAQNK